MISEVFFNVRPHKLSEHLLSVEMSFTNNSDDEKLELYFPQWIPGSYMIRDFSKNIIDLQINGKPLTPHSYEVIAPRGQTVTITYLIYAYDLSVRAAHVDDTHAFFNGTSLFFAIKNSEYVPHNLNITDFPSDWKIYTSLRKANDSQENSFGEYIATDYFELVDCPVEIGKPQTVSFTAHGAEHMLVFTGALPNIDLDRIAHDAQKICETEIAFFDPITKRAPFLDTAQKYHFLVLVTENSYGGLEHRSSTALICSRADLPTVHGFEMDDGYVRFLGLVSHEYFHTWLVKRIVPAEHKYLQLDGMRPIDTLWIFEGFTSYYDDLTLAMSKLIDPEKYLELISKTYNAVFAVEGHKHQSIAQSSYEAWTKYYKQDENSPNSISSYYAKGALVAFCIDLFLRARGHSLAEVLQFIWKKLGENFYSKAPDERGGILAIDNVSSGNDINIIDLIEEAVGIRMYDEIKQWAYGKEALPLEELLEGVNLKLESNQSESKNNATLNAKLKQENGRLIFSNVYSGGAAANAGISAKDELIAIDKVKAKTEKLEVLLKGYKAQDRVSIDVFRGDVLKTYDVVLNQQDDEKKISLSGVSPNFFDQILSE